MRNASGIAIGFSSMRVTLGDSDALNPAGPGLRAMPNSQRCVGSVPTRYLSSSADASSMWWAFSISTNAGPGSVASRKRPTASCSLPRRFSSASMSTSGVESTRSP